ncbi:MAG: hypothetical protein ACREYE_16560, partial [Gammaproteobacteria bacterium]
LAGLPLPSASSYSRPQRGHYRYSYRGLSPHKFMPMPGVHKALQPTVLPPLRCGKTAAELGRWGAGKASQRFPIEPMTTQGLPTVVPFDKRHGFGSALALPGSPNGNPERHRLSFSTWASVSCAVGFSLAGLACGFAKPRWHRTGPRPNHALQPTPWNTFAFPGPLVRRG